MSFFVARCNHAKWMDVITNKSSQIKVFGHFLLLSLNTYLYTQKCCNSWIRLRGWILRKTKTLRDVYGPNKSEEFGEGFETWFLTRYKYTKRNEKWNQRRLELPYWFRWFCRFGRKFKGFLVRKVGRSSFGKGRGGSWCFGSSWIDIGQLRQSWRLRNSSSFHQAPSPKTEVVSIV